jgi:hypothetical protein
MLISLLQKNGCRISSLSGLDQIKKHFGDETKIINLHAVPGKLSSLLYDNAFEDFINNYKTVLICYAKDEIYLAETCKNMFGGTDFKPFEAFDETFYSINPPYNRLKFYKKDGKIIVDIKGENLNY